jgi:hypothetical protein
VVGDDFHFFLTPGPSPRGEGSEGSFKV